MKYEKGYTDTQAYFGIGIILWAIASWITHVVVCLSSSSWGFLIAGAIFAPVAMIHGTGVWFGAWS